MAELYGWQKPSADTLEKIFRSGIEIALDASDTGSGKTFISLEVVRRLGVPFLVICPKAVRTAWARAAEAFGLTPIGIINPQKLLFKNPYYNRATKEWDLPDGTLIIWDEVQNGTSGPTSKTTVALARTKVYGIPVLAMSATIADSPLKLRALGFLLGLHQFNTSSFHNWCLAHGCKPSPFHRGLDFSKGARGREALKRIHDEIKDRMVRISRADIPEFPEGHIVSNLYNLDEKYAREVNDIFAQMDERLKLPKANPLSELGQAREKVELIKVPLLADLALEALEEGTSPVLFINYHSARESLVGTLAKAGVKNVSQVHGLQKDVERDADIDAFQANRNHVCVVMTQAGGAGISLHDLNGRPRVSFITPSYNAQHIIQCLGRIHRVGGTPVTQTFVLIADTVEEKIHAAIQRKVGSISMLNDGDLAV